MVKSVMSIFNQDINADPNVLTGHTMSFLHGNSGRDSPHVALVTATKLLSEAKSAGTIVGWLGPFWSSSCEVTQGLFSHLNQPQLSYGCVGPSLSSKEDFPVKLVWIN